MHGKWCYLYRAIDHDGNLVDSMLSEKRNMEAAQRFFKQAVAVVGHTPESVTTDGHFCVLSSDRTGTARALFDALFKQMT